MECQNLLRELYWWGVVGLCGVGGLGVSFAFGVLFGRKNVKKVEKAVAAAKELENKAKILVKKIG